MKRFLQSPWGAAMLTAVFFLAIIGGVAVMAKGMIEGQFNGAAKSEDKKAAEAVSADPKKPETAEDKKPKQSKHKNPDPLDANKIANTVKNLLDQSASEDPNSKDPANASTGANATNLTNNVAPDPSPSQPTNKAEGQSSPTNSLQTESENKAKDKNEDNKPEVEWSYGGDTGPSEWHKLKSEWAIARSGIRQSPIDITPAEALPLSTLKPVEINYESSLHHLIDNGHTIQVNLKNPENFIVITDQKYELIQFHFHAASEHTIDGQAARMELHLVHKLVVPDAEEGQFPLRDEVEDQWAVIAVLVEEGPEPHLFIKDLWADLDAVKPKDGGIRVRMKDLISLLPPEGKRSYYRYNGSLTTPPCTENVLWTVMDKPIHFSAEQIRAFTERYPNNSRPKMKKARRFVLKYEDKPAGITPVNLVPIIPQPETKPEPGTSNPPESLEPLEAPEVPKPINPLSPMPEDRPGAPPDYSPRHPEGSPLSPAPSIGVRGGNSLPGIPKTPEPR